MTEFVGLWQIVIEIVICSLIRTFSSKERYHGRTDSKYIRFVAQIQFGCSRVFYYIVVVHIPVFTEQIPAHLGSSLFIRYSTHYKTVDRFVTVCFDYLGTEMIFHASNSQLVLTENVCSPWQNYERSKAHIIKYCLFCTGKVFICLRFIICYDWFLRSDKLHSY